MKENCAAALTPRIKGVIAPSFSADADLSGIVFDGRKNSSFFKARPPTGDHRLNIIAFFSSLPSEGRSRRTRRHQ
jgi:hypothetical protein